MLCRSVIAGAVLALSGFPAGALPVYVALDWPSGMTASTSASIHIRAIPMVGDAAGAVPVEAEAGTGGVALDLGEGVWQVQASAPGYWSQETEVAVTRQELAVTRLALWPAASLHGEIAPAAGEQLPQVLKVRLSATPPAYAAPAAPLAPVPPPAQGPSRAELRCPIDNGTWSCVGPAGQFDVQFEAAGYAPRYEWEVSLKAAESTDLGRTELRRTASVFGRAVRQDGSDPQGPCRATLRPDVERRGAPEPDSDSAPAPETPITVPLSRRGYFQVVGVLPGRHVLTVECPAASGLRELIVQADGETRIDLPLLLEELTLDIAITPMVDPAGRPWQLTVEATTPRLLRIADKAAASADGRWRRCGLMTGNYRVVVSSFDGTKWLQRNVDLHTGSGPLSLHLGSVKVAGRVLLSSEPVRARLVFVNDAGGARVTLASGDDGRFQGVLPVAPEARDSDWTVEAHVAQPPVNRTMLGVDVPMAAGRARTWLDLALPTIAVRGSVVSEDGRPQRGAQVTFENSSGARTITSTDNAGNFEMPELPPGKYTAVAGSDEGSSDRTPFDVTDGSEGVLKLVLKPSLRVPFYVVSGQGPVSDAVVQIWIPPGLPQAFTRTDQDGRFEVKLPRGTAEVGLTVGAPGYALKLTRMPISTGADSSQNPNTVTLGVSGGSLVLNFQPPDRTLDSSATLYLVHDGAIQDARTLASWGTDQSGTSGDGPAEIEAIEPGSYALCVLADAAQLPALWQGPLPPNLCRTGSVQQNQTLTLSPK